MRTATTRSRGLSLRFSAMVLSPTVAVAQARGGCGGWPWPPPRIVGVRVRCWQNGGSKIIMMTRAVDYRSSKSNCLARCCGCFWGGVGVCERQRGRGKGRDIEPKEPPNMGPEPTQGPLDSQYLSEGPLWINDGSREHQLLQLPL